MISAFASLVGVSVGITSSAVELKICALTEAIQINKSIIKKKRKKHEKHNKTLLLAKTKLNKIEVLISNALINSNFNHDKFFPVNDVLKYNEMKEEIESP